MEEKSPKNKWCVYRHTSPSGKVYIGITSKNPEIRWCKGIGYHKHIYFGRAIAKYGWDNIKHEILLKDISKSEAIYTERYLIKWYKSHNLSYNITDGGDGVSGIIFSKESRDKISTALTGIKRGSETRKLLSKHFSKPVLQLDPDTEEVLHEYPSAKEASLALGHSKEGTAILNVINGRNKTAYGYKWKRKSQK